MATVQIRTRIDRNLKKKSDAVLKSIGLDTGSYVSMALSQLVSRRGLPFAVMEPDSAYFVNEYGLKPAEAVRAGGIMKSESARARRTGKLREITSADDLAP
jgi:antitoxin component of RelBE/YafQ-DinJ toxin-antitoxin module